MSAQTTTHQSLLARVSEGKDPSAWPEFCGRYEELIRRFAQRRGVRGADGDDVVQDVLLALNRAMPGFEYDPQKGKFRAYLKTIVIRAIVRKFRDDSGAASLEQINQATWIQAADQQVDDLWEDEWRQHHLRRALKVVETEFGTGDVQCFREYVIAGKDANVVAQQLGMSIAQVYQAKHRMLKRLRTVIAEQVGDEG